MIILYIYIYSRIRRGRRPSDGGAGGPPPAHPSTILCLKGRRVCGWEGGRAAVRACACACVCVWVFARACARVLCFCACAWVCVRVRACMCASERASERACVRRSYDNIYIYIYIIAIYIYNCNNIYIYIYNCRQVAAQHRVRDVARQPWDQARRRAEAHPRKVI